MARDRYQEIEELFRQRGEIRDRQIADLETALAVASAATENMRSQITDHSSAIGQLQTIQPPSVLALWGPALATAVTLASLAVFVLDERTATDRATIKPILEDVKDLKKDVQAISGSIGQLRVDVGRHEERTKGMDK